VPDRWRRTPQDEFREQVRLIRRLHNLAMQHHEQDKRAEARQQWFDELQIAIEQLAETPTVWRGVNEPPATPWQAILGVLGTGNPFVWFVFGILVFAWVAGLINVPLLGE
jgi:hypothetical protein